MIQNPSKELTLIVYDSPKSPKYFKINKAIIKSLIVIIPLLVITSISISFIYSMFLKNQVNDLRSEEPEIIMTLKSQTEILSKQIETLTSENKLLTTKLSLGSSKETPLSDFGLFTAPVGMKDLRDEKLLDIKNLAVENTENKTIIKFDLANNSPTNEKLAGYISIIQYQGNLIHFYPNYELGVKNLRLDFSNGESFSFSRFRPTIAEFKKISKISARFKIYIFNRTGDLIAYRQVGPYNIN